MRPSRRLTLPSSHHSPNEARSPSSCWDGDEQALPLSEGVKLQFFHPRQLSALTVPPYISDGIRRALTSQPG